MTNKKKYRSNEIGSQRTQYQKNKAKLLKIAEYCALCGAPIDRGYKFPHPLSATIDHIQPISKGGHPSDINNLQVAHLICNQLKGTKETLETNKNLNNDNKTISNRDLPLSIDWTAYRSSE